MVVCTDCTGSCKSTNHTITTMSAHQSNSTRRKIYLRKSWSSSHNSHFTDHWIYYRCQHYSRVTLHCITSDVGSFVTYIHINFAVLAYVVCLIIFCSLLFFLCVLSCFSVSFLLFFSDCKRTTNSHLKVFLTFTSLNLVLLWQLVYLFCSSIVINTVIVTAGTFEP